MKDKLNNLKETTARDFNTLRQLIHIWARSIDDSKEIDFSTYIELIGACHQVMSDIDSVTSLHNKLLTEEKNKGAH